MISFGFVIGALLFAYLLYATRGAILIVGVIAGGWHFWDYNFRSGGAEFDKAHYCEVLGDDLDTAEWKNVLRWTAFDERFDRTTAEYLSVFNSTTCTVARSIADRDPGNYGKIDEDHGKLGYIYRYYFYRNGKVTKLYRDHDQFIWQRALLLRVDEDCTLDRETGACVAVPPDQECTW